MNTDYRKVEELFRAALEVPPGEERQRFLATACQQDATLLERLEALLRAHESAGDFLDPSTSPPVPVPGSIGDGVPVGGRVGSYRVLERVAQGGLCSVYLAEQLEPVRRPVALKVLKPAQDTPFARERLESERQAMAVLDHPNIVRVYDAGTTLSGLPYLVLEWIRGPLVTHYADDARLSLRHRLQLFLQVCAGVAHAHSRGVIHRDIKPANILVPEYDGVAVPKIIDFGIAKGEGGVLALEIDGRESEGFQGTPTYMSPEQAAGDPGLVDARADVFSLGAVLYELLTGLVPFDGEGSSPVDLHLLLRSIATREFLPPSVRCGQQPPQSLAFLAGRRRTKPPALLAALQGDLDAILAKALSFDRDGRYASVAELATDIRRYLECREVSVRPLSWAGRSKKFMWRNRVAMAGAGTMAAFLLAASWHASLQYNRTRTIEQHALHQQEIAAQAKGETVEAKYQLMVTLGSKAVDEGNAAEAMYWFARAAALAPPQSQKRDVHLRRVQTLSEHVAVPIRARQHFGSTVWMEFSPNSQYLAARNLEGSLMVWDWPADRVLDWPQALGKVLAADWSPVDGHLAVVTETGGAELRQLPGGTGVAQLQTGETHTALKFSPRGDLLAVAGRTLRFWSIEDHAWLPWEWEHPAPVYAVGYSADGSHLVTASTDHKARVFARDLAASRWELLGEFHHEKDFNHLLSQRCCDHALIQTDLVVPLFIAADSSLLTWTDLGRLTTWNIPTGQPTGTLEGTCFATRLLTSPEARWTAVAIRRGAVELRSPDRLLEPAEVRLQHRERICDLAFGPNEDSVLTVSADRTARLWHLPQGTPLFSAVCHSDAIVQGAFSGNGECIATCQIDGLIRICRLPDVELRTRAISLEGPGPWKITASANGERLSVGQRLGQRSRVSILTLGDSEECGLTSLALPGKFVDAAWSPDGDQLATLELLPAKAPESVHGRLVLRPATAPSTELEAVSFPFSPARLVWHPHGHRVVMSDTAGGLWSVQLDATPNVTRFSAAFEQGLGMEDGLSFSADGSALVRWWISGRIQVWDGHADYLRFTLDPPGQAPCLITLSPTEPVLLATDGEGISVLRRLADGAKESLVLKHEGGLMSQHFCPDGKWIVTSGHDRRVLVWDRFTGKLLFPPLVHRDEAFDCVFPADESWLATICRDGTFCVWDTDSGTALVPPWSAGESLSFIHLAPRGRQVLLMGEGSRVWIRDVPRPKAPVDWSMEEIALLSEIVAGVTGDRAPAEVMTTDTWKDRMQRLRALRPDYFVP